ncbi:VWA domain-containing protein [Acidithiobacillus ferridurans]|uniref:VWA domain-containing protein n=1 Tax=Acidithiobacillus ferridurans TaxID=1232575 RepID=A0A8X8G9F4_ACIFI|nr:VWA domain-containing protein [Acidithiobacillus ferridurans]MBU2715836.1 VWA domain-containing protein [Acidithiobacillus ferridurans]MBU2722833.1 VWA domain-containing protein [Acidithiobacillus ferridurans]MBU2727780.1 VWA domain-containing protein [Acidithiobacillus ferridurans]
MIDLKKSQEKAGIQLKKHGVDAATLPSMHVGVCLDVSGSMSHEYHDGHVQNALTHLLGLAMHMDKTGCMDVFTFENSASQCREPATESNYHDYVRRYILDDDSVDKWGGTDYAPAIHLAYQHYYPDLTHLHTADAARRHVEALVHHGHGLMSRLFGHHKPEAAPEAPVAINPADHQPTLMLFLTDGECGDHEATRHAVHAATGLPLFWAFVGLGHDSSLLRELSRETDAEFVNLEHIRISDDELYGALISQKMTGWLRNLQGR